MKYSIAMTESLDRDLRAHLARPDGQEDVCFAVWNPSQGSKRTTALLHSVILPETGDRRVHGNASFNPGYVERAVRTAAELSGGLALLHSHPASGWQGMSRDDVKAEQRLAPIAKAATGQSLVGLTLATRDGTWSGRFWEKVAPRQYRRRWCESVRIIGDRLAVHFNDALIKPPEHRPSQARTVAAWGPDAQARLARLKIGIVGLGSVGSIVAEALARTGVRRVVLLDFQSLEEANLDRTLNATFHDARRGHAKVQIAARALRRHATAQGFRVEPYRESICEDSGFRRALDCDVLFSCVDRPWPRSVLNLIAYSHLIPVIDGGILAHRDPRGRLRGADWKAHVIGPSRRCLRCLRQYDPGLVAVEQRGDLDDPKYLAGLEKALVQPNENVFGFSLGLASLEILQLIMLVVAPAYLGWLPAQNYHLTTGQVDVEQRCCDEKCIYPDLVARGEMEQPGTGQHRQAHLRTEAARYCP